MDEEKPKNDLLNALRANNLLDATKKVNKEEEVHISADDMRSIRNSNYKDHKDKYDKSYVIQNKKTKVIVEVVAASSIMAAKTLGWRPRHTIVIQENEVENKNG